ncbi:hypothetical protein PInf_007351 [Phytophthora infestans]|nr:hypothetical protein PInf_007351 [Phytophthora infestans]
MDEALTRIAPKKEPKRRIQIPIPTVQVDEDLYVLSFDGSARVRRGGGAYSAILWRLPGWEVVRARSTYAEGLTVNEAEYNGLLLGLDLLKGQDPTRLVICGDSNLVIRQVRGEIDCKAPALTLLRQKGMVHLRGWTNHELVHVKRDWNANSHMVTPRSESRMQRIYAGNEGSFGRRGGPRAPKGGARRRQVDSDGWSSDDDSLVRTFDEEDPQVELMRRMNELATLNDVDPTPRIEMASHRPLDRITPFSGSRNKSESCMQWLPVDADKWCIPFELSIRDRAIHWFRQLRKKTKRKWKLLSDAPIRYYCSQFTQTALSRYYSAKRERNEHLCDYINRLNGYARTARLHFEKSGRDAKEHVQQFLAKCDDDKLAESLYHARVADIHELEEIIEDVLKGKERMAKRDSEYRYSKNRDARRDDGYSRNNRRDDRRRDDNRNKPRVTLIEATVDDLLAELEGREAAQGGNEYSNEDPNAYDDVQDEYNDFQPEKNGW